MPCSYFHFWGKNGLSSQGGPACHLLAYHCLDVAAAASALLDQDPLLRRRLAACAGMEEERFVRWTGFFLALHDVGKFSERFQNTRRELVEALGGVASRQAYHTRHDSLGLVAFKWIILPRAWKGNWFGLDQSGDGDEQAWNGALLPWAQAVTGHHGRPPQITGPAGALLRPESNFCGESRQAVEEFSAAASSLLLAGGTARSFRFDGDLESRSRRLSWALAGLAVLADWIGSDERFFPCETAKTPLEDYWSHRALPGARRAVRASGVLPSRPSLKTGMAELFPERRPSPLQAYASECGLSEGPQLFILEDATGSGKTEAALVLAHRLMTAGRAEGLFVALPTMATANAMYDRLSSAYLRLFDGDKPVSLILAHGARHLHDGFTDSLGPEPQGPGADSVQGEETASAHCAAWLADNRKKALLAGVGVGTVDQALLAVLPAKHQSLRLLGLGRSVLIVDEVHACDPYMHAVLRVLLRFQAAQGGSAILLSATLPLKMRRELAQSFREGLMLPAVQLRESRYPLATQVATGEVSEHPLSGRPDMPRTPRVELVHDEEEIVKRLLDALAQGACACWMRNTIKDAIAACDRLSDEVPPDRLILFHSRFAMADRLDIEGRVLEAFGPNSTRNQRAGKLLVSTQVAEQSLDLDFDFLASDLAPMDRMIQRIGRLHRHRRDGQGKAGAARESRPQARCIVLSPPLDRPSQDWYKDMFKWAGHVYPAHGRLWLTASLLAGRRGFSFPDDARDLVERVFGDDAEQGIPKPLMGRELEAEGKDKAGTGMARLNVLKLDDGYRSTPNHWIEDVETPTRLGERNSTLRLARWDGERLSPWASGPRHEWDMSQVDVGGYRVASEQTPNEPALAEAKARAKDAMPDKGKWSILVPMRPAADGAWQGVALDRHGREIELIYHPATGLRFPAAEERD